MRRHRTRKRSKRRLAWKRWREENAARAGVTVDEYRSAAGRLRESVAWTRIAMARWFDTYLDAPIEPPREDVPGLHEGVVTAAEDWMTDKELDAIRMRLYQRNLFRVLDSDFETGAATYTREMQEDVRCDISALLAEVERLREIVEDEQASH